MTVRQRIFKILNEYIDDSINLEGNYSLVDDYKLDSLQIVAVLSEIDNEFGLSFEQGEIVIGLIDDIEKLIVYLEMIEDKEYESN